MAAGLSTFGESKPLRVAFLSTTPAKHLYFWVRQLPFEIPLSASGSHPPSPSRLTKTTRSDCWLKFEVLEERRTRPVPRNNEAAGSVLDVASPPLLPPPPPSPPLPPPLLLLLLLYARAAAAASSVALLPSLPLAEEDLLPFSRRIQSI